VLVFFVESEDADHTKPVLCSCSIHLVVGSSGDHAQLVFREILCPSFAGSRIIELQMNRSIQDEIDFLEFIVIMIRCRLYIDGYRDV
jgi:hypothetical protein